MATAETTGTSSSDAWETEYRLGGIPSSVREGPSSSVEDFVAYAVDQGISTGQAIDIGCGSGRNSLHLAKLGFQVTAIDYAKSQVERFYQSANAASLSNMIRMHHHDVRHRWPVDVGSQHLAIDAFCFKHQISEQDVQSYIENARVALAHGGLMMISFAGRLDGYYAQFPTSDGTNPGQVICDPGNGILSRLYDWEEVAHLFAGFDLVRHISKLGRNEMHGQYFDRETHIIYLKRA